MLAKKRMKAQRYKNCCCPREKYWLCDGICEDCEYGLPGNTVRLDGASFDLEMLQTMRGRYPPPIVRKNGNGTIWVDRYYVAYRLYGEIDVRYVYMTRYHILEEVYSYRAASKLRNKQVKLPAEIQKQFAYALKHMDGNIWTDPEYIVK